MNELLPIEITDDGITISIKYVDPENISSSINSIDDGRVIFANCLNWLNLICFIDVNEDDTIKWHVCAHDSNSLLSTFVKSGSNLISCNDEHPKNALLPIEETDGGISILESYYKK